MKQVTAILLILFVHVSMATAYDAQEYNHYLDNWNQKIKLASQSLEDAEKELKDGNEMQACLNQREAAAYGIDATESLIRAFKISGSTDDLSNIKIGLKKWEELRDFC